MSIMLILYIAYYFIKDYTKYILRLCMLFYSVMLSIMHFTKYYALFTSGTRVGGPVVLAAASTYVNTNGPGVRVLT